MEMGYSPTMKQLTYHDAARTQLAQGVEELAEGDVRQASEKGWGAAAQMVKAVASRRGWRHDGHAALFAVIDRLVAETGNAGLGRRFHVANSLHQNFYEDWQSAEAVGRGLADVGRLIDELEPLLA